MALGDHLLIAERSFGASKGRSLLEKGSVGVHTCLERITVSPDLQRLCLLQVRQSLPPAMTSNNRLQEAFHSMYEGFHA